MKKLLFVSFMLVALLGCSSSDNDGKPVEGTYDRTAMLTHWADNIIIPAFTNYVSKVDALASKTATFNTTPTLDNLAALRQAWLDAYTAYQYVGIYDIGKAEELYLIESSNTYPADVAGIEANIASGNYNLQQFGQFVRQGYPGLDYLLNGLSDSDSIIVDKYSTGAEAPKYRQYLTDVVSRLKQTGTSILTDWNNGYRETFISKAGTQVSSSVNQITNNFVKNLEKDVRTPKLGIPAGLYSNGTTFPDKVEAYYKNNINKMLLTEAMKASQDFFNGKPFNGMAASGPGLKAYLDAVNAVRNGQPLGDIINTQYTAAFTATQPLGNSLSQQVMNDNTKMIEAYDALQQVVIYIKLDMLQGLNIPIDYVDGDGD